MTLVSLQSDVIYLFLFLLIGFTIREFVKPLQRLFIPASIIGGVLLLILGPQVAKVVPVPGSFSSFSGVLINLIMTAAVFGASLSREKAKFYGEYICFLTANTGWQIVFGVLVGALFSIIWPQLPKAWGIMATFSFYGGHGNAGAAGAVFAKLGVPDNLGIGMVLSTFGLITAIGVGMPIVNYAVRKNWAALVHDVKKQPDYMFGGTLPKEAQTSIGTNKVSSVGINSIALQLSLLLLCMWFGGAIFTYVGKYIKFVADMPSMVRGTFGALVIWPLLTWLKLDKYVDKKTINQISGFALEMIVLTATATLSIKLVTTLLAPLLLMTLVFIILNILTTVLIYKWWGGAFWFEKGIMLWGAAQGNTANGLTLLRTIDPTLQSGAADAHGIASSVGVWMNIFPAIFPAMLMNGMISTIGWGAAMVVGGMLILFLVFKKGRNQAVSGS